MSGTEFRQWRRVNDITQGVVADSIIADKSTISRWEHETISISTSLYNRLMDFIASKM